METKTLQFGETFQEAITIGVKNAPSIIAAIALWLVTIWIPYLNIGTTIAIALLPTELAKGNIINPLGIFESKYRRYMGEYLLTVILTGTGHPMPLCCSSSCRASCLPSLGRSPSTS